MTTRAVGYIGLGRMGGGMAHNLLKSLGALYVFDPIPEAVKTLQEAGATVCARAADLAQQCDVVFICVPFAPEVRAVMFGSDGVASAARQGLTVIDTTTLDRTDALAIADEAAQSGMAYWDCPISGMPFRAQDGTLTVMFGGTKEAFADAKPLLESFGEFVVHCGPLGSGQAMKALNNVIYNVNIVALCEVLPLAVSVGLDPNEVARVVTSASSRSFASEYFVPRMMDRVFDYDFAMEDAYKDIVNVQKMGVDKKAMLPVVNAMIASYQAAMAAGYGREPKSAMLKIYEDALGVQFRHPEEKA
ncbi:MAG: NAD(P)-dependent oxidoreductase [Hyphomicrobiaceae bacterium]